MLVIDFFFFFLLIIPAVGEFSNSYNEFYLRKDGFGVVPSFVDSNGSHLKNLYMFFVVSLHTHAVVTAIMLFSDMLL